MVITCLRYSPITITVKENVIFEMNNSLIHM